MNAHQEGKSTGAIIGAVIVIIILVVGGILLSQKEHEKKEMMEDTQVPATVESIEEVPETEAVEEAAMKEVEALSPSTEVNDIEADLEVISDLSELDAELEALEAELAL